MNDVEAQSTTNMGKALPAANQEQEASTPVDDGNTAKIYILLQEVQTVYKQQVEIMRHVEGAQSVA